MDTYSKDPGWLNDSITVEESRRQIWEAMPPGMKYAHEVEKVLRTKRKCPLLIQMYGSMEAAYRVKTQYRPSIFKFELEYESPKPRYTVLSFMSRDERKLFLDSLMMIDISGV